MPSTTKEENSGNSKGNSGSSNNNNNNNSNNKNNEKGKKNMDMSQFKSYVERVGAEKIVKLIFDNGRCETFPTPSSFADIVTLMDDDGGIIRIRVQEPISGVYTYHDELIDSLQAIIVVDNVEDKQKVPYTY